MREKTSFGVALYGTENSRSGVQFAKLAEDLGYQNFWVGDSHMIWREVYVLLGAIAIATKRLRIGPGVTHPEIRHFTVTASAMATLSELSEGRAFLGIGVGATGPENIGMKPVTVERLEETLGLLKRLLAGEAVQLNGKESKCIFASGPRIPIYIGTRSFKAMRMAAAQADGVIYTGEASSVETIIDSVKKFSAEAKRDDADVKFVYRIPCSIAENRSAAREEVKGKIARAAMTHLGRLYRMGRLEDEEDRRAVERLWKYYDTYHHMGPEHAYLVRDEWVDRFAVAGAPGDVRDRIRWLMDFGMDEITIIPFGDSKEYVIKAFAEEVMAKL